MKNVIVFAFFDNNNLIIALHHLMPQKKVNETKLCLLCAHLSEMKNMY